LYHASERHTSGGGGTYEDKATKKLEASHEFGSSIDPNTGKRVKNYLTPDSSAWKTITSCIRPRGDIVLTGCEVAKQGWDYTKTPDNPDLLTDGQAYVEYLFHDADKTRTPTIHAYDENVRHRTYWGRPSVTTGRQHSRSTEGSHVEGPERPPKNVMP
jgi:hypothetical protein